MQYLNNLEWHTKLLKNEQKVLQEPYYKTAVKSCHEHIILM